MSCLNDKLIEFAGGAQGVTILLVTGRKYHVQLARNNLLDEGFAVQINPSGAVVPGKWIGVQPAQHSLLALTLHKATLAGKSLVFSEPCTASGRLRFRPGR